MGTGISRGVIFAFVAAGAACGLAPADAFSDDSTPVPAPEKYSTKSMDFPVKNKIWTISPGVELELASDNPVGWRPEGPSLLEKWLRRNLADDIPGIQMSIANGHGNPLPAVGRDGYVVLTSPALAQFTLHNLPGGTLAGCLHLDTGKIREILETYPAWFSGNITVSAGTRLSQAKSPGTLPMSLTRFQWIPPNQCLGDSEGDCVDGAMNKAHRGKSLYFYALGHSFVQNPEKVPLPADLQAMLDVGNSVNVSLGPVSIGASGISVGMKVGIDGVGLPLSAGASVKVLSFKKEVNAFPPPAGGTLVTIHYGMTTITGKALEENKNIYTLSAAVGVKDSTDGNDGENFVRTDQEHMMEIKATPGTAVAAGNPGYLTLPCPEAVGKSLHFPCSSAKVMYLRNNEVPKVFPKVSYFANWVEGVALEMSYQLSKETLSPITKDPIHLEFAAWVGDSPP